jgi:DNA polymerase III alpha subunit
MIGYLVNVNFDRYAYLNLDISMTSGALSKDSKDPKNKNFISIRSFLRANVDNILEHLSSRRKDSLNDTDDLFGEASSEHSGMKWKTDFENKKLFDVLLEEKESLGIYVSGNPFENYAEIIDDVRARLYSEDIHLALIEKVKKVVTRSGSMMLALQITTLEDSFEGIIFSKKAMQYSSVLQEKEVFWILGKVSRRKGGDGDNEYDEVPRILVDHVVPFTDGVLSLVDGQNGFQVAVNTEDYFKNKDWNRILTNPETYFDKARPTKDVQKIVDVEIKIPLTTPADRLKQIKSLLGQSADEPECRIVLYVETKGHGYRKSKNQFLISKQSCKEVKNLLG